MFKHFICSIIIFSFLSGCKQKVQENNSTNRLRSIAAFDTIPERKWWKEAIVYQIYPRSFQDSDGDGVGDLKGIISRLDYLKSLGVDAVWLNPIYESPNDDNGYDISDYRKIFAQFGTMQDFETLLNGMHDRGIKLIMDLVVNHSSDEHEWFKQSRSSRTNPYRNYYHWWPAEKGKPNARFSFFDVNNDAWRYDSLTNAYYLHYFSVKQPDLNWENPKLRQEVYDIMKFWLDKGIDGFRMDAFQYVAKDTSFPALPAEYKGNFIPYYGSGKNLHAYIQEMNREVISKYDIMTVAEGAGANSTEAMLFVSPERKELDMAYHFEAIDLAFKPGKYPAPYPEGYSRQKFKTVYTQWDSAFATKGWLSIFLANHDQPRMVSHWGNDQVYREASGKLLTTFLMSMRGTPYYYYGDEIGMTNIRFDSIEQYNDVSVHNRYIELKQKGENIPAFLEALKYSSRDNGRTPFQWNATKNAGFTKGEPWMPVNKNYVSINAAAQEKDSNSILNYFRKMVDLRKNTPALIYGSYKLLPSAKDEIYAYTRILGSKKLLIVLNLSDTENSFSLPQSMMNFLPGKILINNYRELNSDIESNTLQLKPWQAVIIE